MGSGGTEWETGDTFDQTRLNKKTRFVGTDTQASNLILSPQVGQQVYCTESGSTFQIDKLSTYNSSSAWITPNVDVSSEQTLGYTDTAAGNFTPLTENYRTYRIETMPTDEKFYIITGISTHTSGGSFDTDGVMGVDLLDSLTPTTNSALLVALTRKFTVVNGQEDVSEFNTIMSKPIRGGSVIGIWINVTDPGANQFLPRQTTGSSHTLYQKAETFTSTPKMANSTAWTTTSSSTEHLKIKAHFRGYS